MRPRLPHAPPQWVKPSHDGVTLEYEVELITPMFGGGVTARTVDENMPIRAREVRGQLRSWWRTLARCGAFPTVAAGSVRDYENELWGIADERNTITSLLDARVKCTKREPHSYGRFRRQDNPSSPNEWKYSYVPDRWLRDDHGEQALRYVLFAFRGELDKHDKRVIVRGPGLYVRPPYRVGLRLVLDRRAPSEQIHESVRWWAAFGGIGARTRRGAGAVAVSRNGNRLAPPAPEEVARLGMCLVQGDSIDAGIAEPGLTAWKQCARALFQFRQGPGFARDPGGERPGHSRWPEARAIRRLVEGQSASPQFPRAALGLPIQFQRDPGPYRLIPKGRDAEASHLDRLASPVILKPMALADGKIAPIALRLPGRAAIDMEIALQEPSAGGWNDLWVSSNADWWANRPTCYPSDTADPKIEAHDPLDALMGRCSVLWGGPAAGGTS